MCVILFYPGLNGKIILAKNRDRNYKAKIVIIHEIINNTEIAYIRDLNSEWVEGLNEYGFGIVNSALQVDFDENAFDDSLMNQKEKLNSQKKYLNALSKSSYNEFQNCIFNKDYYTDMSLQGHTILANPIYGVHIESNTESKPIIKMLDGKKVCTNHGINIKNTGYLKREKYISSVLRQMLIEAEIEAEIKKNKVSEYYDIFNLMNKNYIDLDISFHPYRYTKDVFTTGQLFLDLTSRHLIFNYDKNNCDFKGIINKLPKDYKPVIKISINKIIKNNEKYPMLLNKSKVYDFIKKNL